MANIPEYTDNNCTSAVVNIYYYSCYFHLLYNVFRSLFFNTLSYPPQSLSEHFIAYTEYSHLICNTYVYVITRPRHSCFAIDSQQWRKQWILYITALINVCHNTVDRLTWQSRLYTKDKQHAAIGRRFIAYGLPALLCKCEYLLCAICTTICLYTIHFNGWKFYAQTYRRVR